MSLRIFHIIFITASILLSVFVAVWGVRAYTVTHQWGMLVLSALFFVIGAMLVVYAKSAFRKLKELS